MARSLLEKWTFVNVVMMDPSLSHTAKVVAVNLMWRTNCLHEVAFPSATTIANDTAMSRRAVIDACHALRDAGWITVENRGQQTNIYRFNWSKADEEKGRLAVLQQELGGPDAVQNLHGGSAEPAPHPSANSASEHGKSINGEGNKSPDSSAAPQSPTSIDEKPQASAEPPLQEGSKLWWEDKIWKKTYVEFKEKFYPTISQAKAKSRLGAILRNNHWNIPRVDRAMWDTIRAEPALDAWQYVIAILREKEDDTPPNLRGSI